MFRRQLLIKPPRSRVPEAIVSPGSSIRRLPNGGEAPCGITRVLRGESYRGRVCIRSTNTLVKHPAELRSDIASKILLRRYHDLVKKSPSVGYQYRTLKINRYSSCL